MLKLGRINLSFNSPAVLTFVAICFSAFLLNAVTNGAANSVVFSIYRTSPLDPMQYIRLIGHIFGHANWSHLMSNMTLILVVGPSLEEKYGSRKIVLLILLCALLTGLTSIIFMPNLMLLGASGIVFAFILLSSITRQIEAAIPMTLVLVALIFIGQQLYEALFIRDNVSQLTHILGGIVGIIMGYYYNQPQKRGQF